MITIRLLRFALSALFCITATISIAQPPGIHPPISPIEVGSIFINGGVGLGEPYLAHYGTPFGVKVSVNWGLAEAGPGVITLGASAGGSFSNGQTAFSDHSSSNSVAFLARGAWHYGWEIPGLDLYGGLSAGIGFHRYHFGDPTNRSSNSAHLWPGLFVGASYFITPVFGFNAEAGADITNLQIGLVVKIR
jgi:hypothetical protein